MATGIPRIMEAQRCVELVERGELDWSGMLMGPDSGPRLAEVSDLSERFAEMYARVRMTEAAAYAFREKGDVPERRLIEHRVREITSQRDDIEHLGAQVDEMTIEQLAELGRFFAKQQVQWALGIVDKSLPGWSY